MKNCVVFVVWLCVMGFIGTTTGWGSSIVTEWNPIVIEATIKDTPQPTIGTRTMMIVFTSAYEAWQAYDPVAVGWIVGSALDGTGGDPTLENKNEAISHAIYTALLEVAPSNKSEFDALMRSKGYTPGDMSLPAQLGRAAANAVLMDRENDGSNAQNRYADTTGYQPRDPSILDAWQPLRVPLDDPNGTPQKPLTPHWGKVKPFAVVDMDTLRLPPPAKPGTPAWNAQLQELIDISANLTVRQKVIAEYWRPERGTPPMLWGELTELVSRKYNYGVDEDAKLYFLIHSAMFDAGICCWENKYFYDYVRPVTAIRNLGNIEITAWGGPGKGTQPMLASQWHPYQKISEPTPPFPEYGSGHSTFGSAWAESMRRFTGSDEFGGEVTIHQLAFEGITLDPPIVLHWDTFTQAAQEAGISRLYGGIHFRDGNINAQNQGKWIGASCWTKANQLFQGFQSSAANWTRFQ